MAVDEINKTERSAYSLAIAAVAGFTAWELWKCYKKHGKLNFVTVSECAAVGIGDELLDQAKNLWDEIGGKKVDKFFAKTVPNALKTAGNETKEFFTHDIPHFMTHDVGGFFKKEAHKVADLAKKVPDLAKNFSKELGHEAMDLGKEVAKVTNLKHDFEGVVHAASHPLDTVKNIEHDVAKVVVPKPVRNVINDLANKAIPKPVKKVEHAVEDAGHAIEHTAEKVEHKVEHGVKKAAHKVKHFFHHLF